jgi:predicted transcriptional regulator
MVKKPTPAPEPVPSSDHRSWRAARASFRMHDDLRDALDFLAKGDRRTVSQVIERIVLDRVRLLLTTEFTDDGVVVGSKEFRLKDPNKRV